VAVSDYAAAYPGRKDLRAWPALHSELDAENMRRSSSVTRYGFRDEDVLILSDLKATRAGKEVPGAATREGILSAFRTTLLDLRSRGTCWFSSTPDTASRWQTKTGTSRTGWTRLFSPMTSSAPEPLRMAPTSSEMTI
jgi:hypothetical protein